MSQASFSNYRPASRKRDLPEGTRIIHHLSDILYGQDDQAQTNQALFRYNKYINDLPREERPDIIAITGNLTMAGTQAELQNVEVLIHSFSAHFTEDELAQHVYIVPGMRDLDWTKNPPNYELFLTAFRRYGLPATITHTPIQLAQNQSFVYPLNTISNPQAFHLFTKQIQKTIDEYQRLAKNYIRLLKKQRHAVLDAKLRGLRDQYIAKVAEMLRLPAQDDVPPEEMRLLRESMLTWQTSQTDTTKASAALQPLKILVTHHPLLIPSDPALRASATGALLQLVQEMGFQIALHDQTTAFEMRAEKHKDIFLRQIGSGSLGRDGNFNEIVAIPNHEKNHWQFEIKAISLLAAPAPPAVSFFLFNPADDGTEITSQRSQENRKLQTRAELEAKLRVAMRQFVESVVDDTPLIPTRPLNTLQDAITSVIFKGYTARVSLAIKTEEYDNVVLRYKYIEPDMGAEQQFVHPFHYPTTAASWALILERLLIFPQFVDDGKKLEPTDYLWIDQRAKSSTIRSLLHERIDQKRGEYERRNQEGAAGNTLPADLKRLRKDIDRAQLLLDKLNSNTLEFSDTYQQPFDQSMPPTFSGFIALPVPLRPEQDAELLLRDEIGVLIIDVRRPESQDVALQSDEMFSTERLDMLRSISDLLYVILSAADKLGRPKGTWHVRRNLNKS